MQNFLIGLDLDGVVYQWDRTARYMIRQRCLNRGETPDPGLSVPSESWTWIQEHSSKEDWWWLWDGGIEAGLFRYGHMVQGATEGARELVKIGEVIVITARPRAAVRDTLAWLARFSNKVQLSGIVIQSAGQKKSQVAPTPDVYIDDGVHNYLDILKNTDARIIQFVQPWNRMWSPQEPDRGRWLRADGWPQTVEKVRWAKEYQLARNKLCSPDQSSPKGPRKKSQDLFEKLRLTDYSYYIINTVGPVRKEMQSLQ